MNTVDLSLWINPLYSIKVGEVQELEEESLENTIWFIGMSQSLIEEFDLADSTESLAELNAYLADTVVSQLDQVPDGQSIEAAILAIETESLINSDDGMITQLTHFACFHYQDDGTLSIFICHTRLDERDAFLEERKITYELLM